MAAACMVLAGCASEPPGRSATFVVVVPDNTGKVGTVAINPGPIETRVNQPYAAAHISPGGKIETRASSDEEVKRRFARALEARPDPPVSFTVYFVEGTDEFAPESRRVVEWIFAEIARRKASEIVVIGHTDRVGTLDYNDGLSRQRAARVRNDLIKLGIPGSRVAAVGRGERELLVATEDEVSEPRNRRVEIIVR